MPLNSQKRGNMLASVWVCGMGGDICFCVKNPILVDVVFLCLGALKTVGRVSNSLDPDETTSNSSSHPCPSFLPMLSILGDGSERVNLRVKHSQVI